jgi:hypothetical protein
VREASEVGSWEVVQRGVQLTGPDLAYSYGETCSKDDYQDKRSKLCCVVLDLPEEQLEPAAHW